MDPAGAGEVRRGRHEPQYAAERARSVERPLRPFEHLDLLDVVEVEIGIGGVEGEPDVAEILADDRLARPVEAAVGDAPYVDLVAARPEVGRGEHRQAVEDRVAAADSEAADIFIVEVDHPRRAAEPVERDALLARGDDDVRRDRFGRERNVLGGRRAGRRGRPARRADDPHRAWTDELVTIGAAGEQLRERGPDAHPTVQRARGDGRDGRIGDGDGDPGLLADGDQRLAEPACGNVERNVPQRRPAKRPGRQSEPRKETQ